MDERGRLPGRREHEVSEFEHQGLRFFRGDGGRYTDQRVGEIFLNIAKDGSTPDLNARDSAIAASLALQHGCDVQVIRPPLTRKPDIPHPRRSPNRAAWQRARHFRGRSWSCAETPT